MENNEIIVYDSGIGGLSVLKILNQRVSNQKILYFGDNENAPYGNLNANQLLSLTIKNLSNFVTSKTKMIIFACNTLSVSVRKEVEEYFKVKTVGVFPNVESELCCGKKVLLLGTKTTVSRYKNINNVIILGFSDLAIDIERKVWNLEKLDFQKHFESAIQDYGLNDKNIAFDSVVLGCTHYYFVKNKIFDHLKPRFITGGNHFTVDFVVKNLKNAKSLDIYCKNKIVFIGKNAKFNEEIFYKVVNECSFI